MGRDDTLYLSCSRSSSFILSPNDTSRRVCLANLVRSMTDGQFHILYFIRYFLISSFISIEIVQVSFMKQFLTNYSVSFSKRELPNLCSFKYRNIERNISSEY